MEKLSLAVEKTTSFFMDDELPYNVINTIHVRRMGHLSYRAYAHTNTHGLGLHRLLTWHFNNTRIRKFI